jgi:hypothetical protein
MDQFDPGESGIRINRAHSQTTPRPPPSSRYISVTITSLRHAAPIRPSPTFKSLAPRVLILCSWIPGLLPPLRLVSVGTPPPLNHQLRFNRFIVVGNFPDFMCIVLAKIYLVDPISLKYCLQFLYDIHPLITNIRYFIFL